MTPAPRSAPDRWLPWVLGGVALAPLLWCWRDFSTLYWFGDEWDLLDQIDQRGLWTWTWQVFAENFVPLFKLLWGGFVHIFNGSYPAMVTLLWLSHALCVVLLSRLLRLAGFGWFPTILTAGVFGLAAGNVETLGWTVQWSAILAALFQLWAAGWFMQTAAPTAPWTWRTHGVLVALVAASAFSFSRGVLTGAGLAGLCLLPGLRPWGGWLARGKTAALCLAPAVLAAVLITLFSTGNHRNLSGHGAEIVQFGGSYFLLNPFHRWLEVDSFGWRTTLVLGVLKVALVAWGLWHTRDRTRELLVFLLLVEAGNAVLLGVGRFHTGLEASLSSRYQYCALLGTLPFLGLWLEAQVSRVARWPRLRLAVALLVVIAAVWQAGRRWPGTVQQWADERGRAPRALLLADPQPPAQGAVPGIPSMSTARAKELIRKYHLH